MRRSDHELAEGVLPIGTLIAERYEIIKFLGGGAMGNVYQADDLSLQSESVAIKILHYEHSRNERLTQRFLEELGHTHNISHPNVIRTYDFGSDRGSLYFTMEYVPGVTLDKFEPLRQFNEELLEKTLIQICQGLSAIHAAGIVHRDLKHGNIIILPDASLKIADFGIARPETSDLTINREIAGSVDYLAPEIWRGGAIRNAVDFYALGCILYELLVGKLPFENDEIHRTIWGHIFSNAPEPTELLNGLPLWLNTLTCWLMAKEPDHRPHGAEEIVQFIKHPEHNEIVPIHEDSKKYATAVPFDKDEAEKMLANALLPSPEHSLIVNRGKERFAAVVGLFRLLFLLMLLFGAVGLYLVRNYPPAAVLLHSRLFDQMTEAQAASSPWMKFFLVVTGENIRRKNLEEDRQLTARSDNYPKDRWSSSLDHNGIQSLRNVLSAPLKSGIDFSKPQDEEASIFAAVTEITTRYPTTQEVLRQIPKVDSKSLHTALSQVESHIEAHRLLTRAAITQKRLRSIEQIGSKFAYRSSDERQALNLSLSKRRSDIEDALPKLSSVKKDALLRLKRWIRFARKIERLNPFAVAASLANKDERIAREFTDYHPLTKREDSELVLSIQSLMSMFDPQYGSPNPAQAQIQKGADKLKKSTQQLISRRLAGLLHAIVTISELEYALREELELIAAEVGLIAVFPRPRTREEASTLEQLKRERSQLLKKYSRFTRQHNEKQIQVMRLTLHLSQLDMH